MIYQFLILSRNFFKLVIIIIGIKPFIMVNAEEAANKKFGYLRSSLVNVRKGPSEEYKVLWKFTKIGIPVELLYSMDNWYLIRDIEGTVGWINKNLVSNKQRYVLIKEFYTPLCRFPDDENKCHKIGVLPKNYILKVKYCNQNWCRIQARLNLNGWVHKKYLWGI